MKKLFIILLTTMLATQGCSMYRIKVVTHDNDVKYYFPQKRLFIGDWVDLNDKYHTSVYSYDLAKQLIEKDKQPKQKRITYIK